MNKSVRPERATPPWWWLGLANRPRSRSFRRRLVLGTWVVWLAVAAYVRLEVANFSGWMVAMVATVITIALWLGSRRYNDLPSLAEGPIDERIEHVGSTATAAAYHVVIPAMLVAWPVSVAAAYWQPNDAGRTDAWLIWAAALLLGTTAPTMLVAWREPDPVASP